MRLRLGTRTTLLLSFALLGALSAFVACDDAGTDDDDTGGGAAGDASGDGDTGGSESGGTGGDQSGGSSSGGGDGLGGDGLGGDDPGGGGMGGDEGSAPECGNEEVESGEVCDDGNDVDADACKNDCSSGPLQIAIESKGTCTADGERQEVLVDLEALLESRGHTATLVDGSALDTAEEIESYDVIVLGGYTANCVSGEHDLALFDDLIEDYLAAGGGLVASGWGIYNGYLTGAPNIAAALPQQHEVTDDADGYLSGVSVSPVGTHPIVDGVTAFTPPGFIGFGNGMKVGATALLVADTTTVGSAWTVETRGRTVFLGPLFAENYGQYFHEALLDGTTPSAEELLGRAVEWAGGYLL